jgi:hypothetical protein
VPKNVHRGNGGNGGKKGGARARLEPIHLIKFGPLAETHPATECVCAACKLQVEEGQYVTMVALGPGADALQRERCREGLEYNAVSVWVHWACATGEEGG